MLVNIMVGFLGILFFLFIFWKKLKEDYSSEIIFKSSFAIIIGIIVGWGIAVRFVPLAFLWLSVIGGLAGLGYANNIYKIRFYESFDALIIAGLPWVSLVFLEFSVANSNLVSFVVFLITLTLIFIYYYFNQHYKEFTWYKSGKIGFAGLATLSIIFFLRLLVAIFRISVISFFSYTGSGYLFELVVNGLALIVSLGILFKLGKKKI